MKKAYITPLAEEVKIKIESIMQTGSETPEPEFGDNVEGDEDFELNAPRRRW